jgi:hypothetical protein
VLEPVEPAERGSSASLFASGDVPLRFTHSGGSVKPDPETVAYCDQIWKTSKDLVTGGGSGESGSTGFT